MTFSDNSQEKREFFRINFSSPLSFKSYSVDRSAPKISTADTPGSSKNISQSGILFQTTENPPALSSILWMDLDIRTLNICQEIENRALVLNKGLLGRVVRVEENPNNADVFDVGVCFLTKDQKDSREVQTILSQLDL